MTGLPLHRQDDDSALWLMVTDVDEWLGHSSDLEEELPEENEDD